MGEMVPRSKVLLIDDSEIALEATRIALERDGFDVRAARSLGEFNVILTNWKPDVVLTDVNMPGVTGPELCQWIKHRIDTDTVPVVLFSDLPVDALKELARVAGADGFVSKYDGLEGVSRQLSSLCESIVW